jgi:O-antigen ligase
VRDLAVPLPFSRPRDLLATIRDGALAVFFVALAFSVSVSQILLVLLVVLAVPWRSLTGDRSAASAALPGADVLALWRHPLTRPFLLLVALTLLSAVFSGDPWWSLWIARDTLRIATFYVVLALTRDATHALRLWRGFLVALTAMACYGLLQAYLCGRRPDLIPSAWMAEMCVHPSRVSGPFSIYMTFGGVLLMGAIFFVAYLANVPWRQAWWMVPAGAVTVAALGFTYSRNAWLGLAAGTMGLVATAHRAARILAVLVGLALLVAVVSPATVLDRMRSIADPQDATIRDRVAMWRAGLSMITDHPLLGVGPGQVRAWYPHYRRSEAVRPSTGHLHNSPVHLAAERGLPAFAAWVWLWVVFFQEAGRVLTRLGRDRSRERALVCASLGGVGGFLAAGLFEHNFGDAEVVMLVYALMALPFVIRPEGTSTAPPEPPPGVGMRRSSRRSERNAGRSAAVSEFEAIQRPVHFVRGH